MNKKVKVAFSSIKLDTRRLEAIEKEIRKTMVTKVGILGNEGRTLVSKKERMVVEKKKFTSNNGKLKNVTYPSDLSNADIGLIHEKGSKSAGIPRRSFIELPLQTKMPGVIKKIGQSVIDGLTSGNIMSAYKKLGILGENIIQGAFSSRGYGRWAANAPSTIRRKGSDMPLIDTSQLRKGISSQVVVKKI